MDKNTKILISISAFALVFVLIFTAYVDKEIEKTNQGIGSEKANTKNSNLKKFKTQEEFESKIDELTKNSGRRGGLWGSDISTPMSATGLPSASLKSSVVNSSPEAAPSYSQTNVQVQGVDEADIAKTDGNYIYTATKNFITISKANPAEDANLTSKIELNNSTPQELFIDGDNLMVFGIRYYPRPMPLSQNGTNQERAMIYPNYPTNLTFVEIYNISDRSNPVLKRKIEFDGSYQTARKIGTDVYFALDSYPSYLYSDQKNISTQEKCQTLVPQYREGIDINSDSKMVPVAGCTNINYIEPVNNLQYAEIIGISISDYAKDISKEVVMGGTDNIYASQNNIYLAQTDYHFTPCRGAVSCMVMPAPEKETTQIYKFKISSGKVDFENSGEVPGRVLNQFSMDEFDGYLRIATTSGHVSRDTNNASSNNVYILDKDLNRTGAIEDIAPGEQIYSARFMGKNAFLVTFKKVDPFFTLDLSDPKNPRLIGKLKIPGYSDYLHPYDDTHIIGIGKNTVESSESLAGTANFAWYQGIKMAMFDVSDFANPKEMFKIEIGDRGTDSPILTDHKALLFDKNKNLLVIPILEAKLTDEQKKANSEGNSYGNYTYQGAYVFNVDLDKGFNLRGRITHIDDENIFKKSGYYFGTQYLSVKRSLYIGNNLYTISDGKILINNLDSLDKIKEIDFNLPKTDEKPTGIEF